MQSGGDDTKRREYIKNDEQYKRGGEFSANNEFPIIKERMTSEELYSGFTEFNEDCVNGLSSRVTGKDDDSVEQSVSTVNNRRFFGVKAVTGTALKAAATFVVVGTAITTVALYNPTDDINKQSSNNPPAEYTSSDYNYEYTTVPWQRDIDDPYDNPVEDPYGNPYDNPGYNPYDNPDWNPGYYPEEQGTVPYGNDESPDPVTYISGEVVTRKGALSAEGADELTNATRKSDSQNQDEAVTKATKKPAETTTQKASKKNTAKKSAENCDHDFKLTSDTANCEQPGTKTYTCSKCKFTKTEQSPATGHNFKLSSTKKATCTQDGANIYTCEKCRKTKNEAIPATGHSFTLSSTKDATCTQNGTKTYKCSRCNETQNESIPATGHDYQFNASKSRSATCTQSGLRVTECSHCHDTKSESIPASGHDYKTTITREATCTQNGQKTTKCSRCGDSRTETISATGHNMRLDSSKTVAATCTRRGEEHYICSKCGYEEIEYIEVKDHNFTKSPVQGTATCQHGNVIVLRCRDCGYTDTSTYDNNIGGHKWVNDPDPPVFQPPKDGGWYVYEKCSECGKTRYTFEQYSY